MKSKNLSNDCLSFLGLFAQPHKVSQTKVTVEFGKERFIFRQNRVVQAGWKGETETETETVKWEKEMRINPDFTIKKNYLHRLNHCQKQACLVKWKNTVWEPQLRVQRLSRN